MTEIKGYAIKTPQGQIQIHTVHTTEEKAWYNTTYEKDGGATCVPVIIREEAQTEKNGLSKIVSTFKDFPEYIKDNQTEDLQEGIQTLIEGYKLKRQSIQQLIKENTFVESHILTQWQAKEFEYKAFITELERLVKPKQ